MAWRLGSLFWTCVLACVGAASSEEAERCPEPAPAPLECGRSPHLSQLPAIGLHVLTANSVCDGNIGSMTMTVFVDGSVASDVGDRTPQVELPCDDSQTSQDEVSSLRAAVQEIVERERPALLARLHNSGALTDVAMQEVTERRPTVTELGRWAFFTPGGTSLGPSSGGTRRHGTLISVDRPVELTRALAECGTVYLAEGGIFMWPGIQIGHNQTVAGGNIPELSKLSIGNTTQLRNLPPDFLDFSIDRLGISVKSGIRMTTLSLMPRVFRIEPLLSLPEARQIVTMARTRMEQRVANATPPQQGLIPPAGKQLVAMVEHRAQRILQIPENHNEPVQVLHYEPHQNYGVHVDYQNNGGRSDRAATQLWFLSDVDSGGATHFPRAGGLKKPSLMASMERPCEGDDGVKVFPSAGMGLMFYSLRPDGAIDPFSLHAGCPPTGVDDKWVANKWVWSGVPKLA